MMRNISAIDENALENQQDYRLFQLSFHRLHEASAWRRRAHIHPHGHQEREQRWNSKNKSVGEKLKRVAVGIGFNRILGVRDVVQVKLSIDMPRDSVT